MKDLGQRVRRRRRIDVIRDWEDIGSYDFVRNTFKFYIPRMGNALMTLKLRKLWYFT